MSRLAKITHQISNEPFSNLLLVLGLTIASIIVWFIADYFYVMTALKNEPMGLDVRHCYNLQLEDIPFESPDYDRHHPATDKAVSQDIATILKRIQQRKDVEVACISTNATPYTHTNSNLNISFRGVTFKGLLLRVVSPEYAEVFKYRGANGQTPAQLAAALRRNEVLLSERLTSFYKLTPAAMTGRTVSDATDGQLKVGGIFKDVKYDEYTSSIYSEQMLKMKSDTSYTTWDEISVRVRPECEKRFIDRIYKEADKAYRVGNIYINKVSSYETMRQTYLNNDYTIAFNRYYTSLVFILINVFLGLAGTFSYRTWKRRQETGLMKVLGATNCDIALRLFAEALLLLTVATGIAIVIELNLTHLKLNTAYGEKYLEGQRFLLTVLISYAVMACTILLSVLLPVIRAIRIKPIDVLKHD